jgi:hypothetical protein
MLHLVSAFGVNHVILWIKSTGTSYRQTVPPLLVSPVSLWPLLLTSYVLFAVLEYVISTVSFPGVVLLKVALVIADHGMVISAAPSLTAKPPDKAPGFPQITVIGPAMAVVCPSRSVTSSTRFVLETGNRSSSATGSTLNPRLGKQANIPTTSIQIRLFMASAFSHRGLEPRPGSDFNRKEMKQPY